MSPRKSVNTAQGFVDAATGLKWHLLIRTNRAYGYRYVAVERNQWVRELKQPRVVERQQVGRLLDTNEVQVTPAFLERFPQFKGMSSLFYWDHRLLSRAEYLEANPDAEKQWSDIEEAARKEAEKQAEAERRQANGEAPEDVEEEPEKLPFLNCGICWAGWQTLIQSGILSDLTAVLGAEDGLFMAQLAVYVLEQGITMQNFEDWAIQTGMPKLKPQSGQRISEMLARIERSHIDNYFKRRYAACKEKTAKRPNSAVQSMDSGMLLAFDSTSISTYSNTIEIAEYGHAKQNPELKQVNLLLVCDELTGEAVYAYEYNGSINDKGSMAPILDHMETSGFDLKNVTIVSDRGYKSMLNTQCLLDKGANLIQGLSIDEDSVKKLLRKYRERLTDPFKADDKYDIVGYTPTDKADQEVWRKKDQTDVRVFIHLYYNEVVHDLEIKRLRHDVAKVLELKREGKAVDPDLWRRTTKFVISREVEEKGKKKVCWGKNEGEMRKAAEFAGYFAIRTNLVMAPMQAFELYRDRGIIEGSFREMKALNDCDRLQATETTYTGKLFLYVLAQSIRRIMQIKARRLAIEKPEYQLPNSLEKLFARVNGVKACRQGKSMIWKVEMLTKTQRRAFEALGVPLPTGRHYFGC